MKKRTREDVAIRDDKGQKQCKRCSNWFPESEFNKSSAMSDGLHVYCNRCLLELNRLARYGISAMEVAGLLIKQDGLCGVCHKPLGEKFDVDHDHETGVVRGILCRHCNSVVLPLFENPDLVESVRRYLK